MADLHSLRDVIRFTGVLGDAGAKVGQATRKPTLNTVAQFVPSIPVESRRSLALLIRTLETLPTFDLSAAFSGPASGRPPFAPVIVVNQSDGAVIETVLTYFLEGTPLPPSIPLTLVNGNDISAGIIPTTFNELGHYEAVIARTGITADGITTLVRRLPFVVYSNFVPPPPPPPPPPPVGPTCSVELAADPPVDPSVTQMRIFGGGFRPNEQLQIREGDAVLATPTADQLGLYSVEIGFVRGLVPTQHAVWTHGIQSQFNSNIAGFTL
jgi:hypothetical protein